MKSLPSHRQRRGAIAPLTALLLIPTLAMVAFAVDIGYIVVAQTDLQNAADSAALAGAGQLIDNFTKYNLVGQTQQAALLSAATANARTYAKNYAGYNQAGGVSSLVLLDGDIEFGFTDANGTYTPQPAYTGYPNTIKVTLRRDSQANGSLRLFFGAVLGTPTVDLRATAAATVYAGNFHSLTPHTSSVTYPIMPFTYDVNHWNNFLRTGKAADGTTSIAPNGSPQLHIYPNPPYNGNFGLLSLDQVHDDTADIANWINNPPTRSQLQVLYDQRLLPLSQHPANQWDWLGNPGLHDADVQTVAAHVGQQYYLPLFKPYDPNVATYQPGVGQGSNYYYDIVQLVSVTITQVSGQDIYVQPTGVLNPDVSYTNVTPAGTGQTPTTYMTPKLSQ